MKVRHLKTIFTHRGNNGEEIKLQYDRYNNLYLNGKKLLTQKKLSLRGYELTLLTLTTMAVFIQAIVAILPYLETLFKIFNSH